MVPTQELVKARQSLLQVRFRTTPACESVWTLRWLSVPKLTLSWILRFLLMSAFLRPVLGGLGQFLYMHFLGGLGQFLYILLIYALFGLKEIASHTSMQMVRSNEKNYIIYSSSMSEQMRNVEPHARLSGNKIIYPNSTNREDLLKLSKEQLINMLLGKQTVSANRAGPVKQTASTAVGPVFKPKSLTQLAAEN